MARQLAANAGGYLPRVGVLSGFAGTGKSTVLQQVVQSLPGSIMLAPTGKAAVRMMDITNERASTIHRWTYESELDEQTGNVQFFRRELNKIKRPDSNLIIVDECSMLGAKVWQDLHYVATGLKCSILLVGDSYQLPPIVGPNETPFSVFDENFACHAKVNLTEIMRQAEGNPIIAASMEIRTGCNSYAALKRLPNIMPLEFDAELKRVLGDGGMVICFKNETRHTINNHYRKIMGFGQEIQAGEPILVLKNNYLADIMNGETFSFTGYGDKVGMRKVFDGDKSDLEVNFFTTKVNDKEVVLGEEVVAGQRQKLTPHWLEKAMWYYTRKGVPYLHCNYGYALTAHKAQGHQARKVMVILEPGVYLGNEDGRRWAYTAITRGEEEVSIFYWNGFRG